MRFRRKSNATDSNTSKVFAAVKFIGCASRLNEKTSFPYVGTRFGGLPASEKPAFQVPSRLSVAILDAKIPYEARQASVVIKSKLLAQSSSSAITCA